MSWLYLSAAIVFEVIGTTLMKFTDGFTRPLASGGVVLFYIISTVFMNFAVKYINLSIVYTVWSGVGTACITLIGFWFFNEPMSLVKIGSIVLIILGVIGLNSNL
jgi:small multidrug resistance pump